MKLHLKAKNNKQLVDYYLTSLHQFHKLGGQMFELTSMLIQEHLKLKEAGLGQDTIDSFILSREKRRNYQEHLSVSKQRLNNMIAKLRKKMILKENKINFRLIPDIKNGVAEVSYMISVDLTADGKPKSD